MTEKSKKKKGKKGKDKKGMCVDEEMDETSGKGVYKPPPTKPTVDVSLSGDFTFCRIPV